ncbi:TATA-binding protein-associated phosphoprotein [Entamoeba marina]
MEKPLQFGESIEEVCKERYETEKKVAPTEKKVRQTRRHKDINRAALTFNKLLGLVENKGFKAKRRFTKSSIKTIKMEKISEISTKGKIIIESNKLIEIGKEVNEMITKTFKKGGPRTTMIEQQNVDIINILNTIPYFIDDHINDNISTTEKIVQKSEKCSTPTEPIVSNELLDVLDLNDELPPIKLEKIESNDINIVKMSSLKKEDESDKQTNENEPNNTMIEDITMNRDTDVKENVFCEQSDSLTQFFFNGYGRRESPTYELNFKPVNQDYWNGNFYYSGYDLYPLFV